MCTKVHVDIIWITDAVANLIYCKLKTGTIINKDTITKKWWESTIMTFLFLLKLKSTFSYKFTGVHSKYSWQQVGKFPTKSLSTSHGLSHFKQSDNCTDGVAAAFMWPQVSVCVRAHAPTHPNTDTYLLYRDHMLVTVCVSGPDGPCSWPQPRTCTYRYMDTRNHSFCSESNIAKFPGVMSEITTSSSLFINAHRNQEQEGFLLYDENL